METSFRDFRIPLAIMTLIAVGAIWWGISLSGRGSPLGGTGDDPFDLGLSQPTQPGKAGPEEEFKGKTKNGGRAPRGTKGK